MSEVRHSGLEEVPLKVSFPRMAPFSGLIVPQASCLLEGSPDDDDDVGDEDDKLEEPF